MSRLALLALIASPLPAWACASCACGDPTLTVMGLEKPFAGRVRLSIDGRYRYEQRPDAGGGAWRHDEGRARLGVSWSITDRIVLAGALPLTTVGERTPTLAWSRGIGLGDAELLTRFVVVRDRARRHLGGLTAGMELPTALRLRRDGVPLSHDVQPGDGAWTPSAGLWYAAYLGAWSPWISASVRGSSVGWEERRPGVTGLFTAALQWQPHPVVAPRLSLDARVSAADTVAGEPDDTTGGWLLQATPGLTVQPTTDVLLWTTLAVPLAQRQAEDTREGLVPALGVTLDL